MIFVTGPLFAGKRETIRGLLGLSEAEFAACAVWDVQEHALEAEPAVLAEELSARRVVIPKNVTSIVGNPFAGSSVRFIYGCTGSAAQTFAANNGFIFVKIDDAWLASN